MRRLRRKMLGCRPLPASWAVSDVGAIASAAEPDKSIWGRGGGAVPPAGGAGYNPDVPGTRAEREMPATGVKDQAHKLVDQLPDDATWDDLLYEIYVRQSIDAGIEDARAGRVTPVDELRQRLGIPK
jgi:hypothetical protein